MKTNEDVDKPHNETTDIYKLAFEEAQDPIFIINENLEVVSFNKAADIFHNAATTGNYAVGDVLCCTFSTIDNIGCGKGNYCKRCSFRQKIDHIFKTGIPESQTPIEFTLNNEGFPDLRLFEMSAKVLKTEPKALAIITLHEISLHIYKEQALIAENHRLKNQVAKQASEAS